jgi:hypothetical protein
MLCQYRTAHGAYTSHTVYRLHVDLLQVFDLLLTTGEIAKDAIPYWSCAARHPRVQIERVDRYSYVADQAVTLLQSKVTRYTKVLCAESEHQ